MSEILYLKNEIQLIENGHKELIVRYGSEVIFSIYKNKELFKKLFYILELGSSKSNVQNQFHLRDKKIIDNYFKFFEKNKLLTSLNEEKYFDRQVKYFSVLNAKSDINEYNVQELILNSSILIIGLGGIGTHIANCLSAVGFGTIGLCDNDKVEESNLNRCTGYKENDIGKPKSKVLQNYLSKTYRRTTFKSYKLIGQKLNNKILEKYNFVVITIDRTKEVDFIITDKLKFLNIPFIFSNYGEQFGMVSKINHDIATLDSKNTSTVLNSYIAPSVYWNSMIIAGITAKEIIAYLTKGVKSISENNYISIDLNQLEIRISNSI